jgi:hypothetical protein
LHDLPVLFYVDWPIVVIVHGRIVVRLIAASVITGLIHVRVVVSRALSWPRGRGILTVVLCGILRWRAYGLSWSGLGFDLGGWCRCRGLLGWLIVIADGLLVECRNARAKLACAIKHSQIVENVVLVVLVGHIVVLKKSSPESIEGSEEGRSARK